MKSHEIDYQIFGNDLQIVEIELDPGETVIAEAGSMCYLQDNISFEAKFGDGSSGEKSFFNKMLDAGKRALAGESLFITHFTNTGSNRRKVSFASPYPGKIIALDLKQHGNEILCQKESFLCASLGTSIDIAFTKKLSTGFFGGEGFILEKLKGDGLVFLHAGGTIIKKELNAETLKVDTGCLVALTSGLNYDIEKAGNLKTMFLGGEGLFLATVSGTGTVYLQSLPFSRLAERIAALIPKASSDSAFSFGDKN